MKDPNLCVCYMCREKGTLAWHRNLSGNSNSVDAFLYYPYTVCKKHLGILCRLDNRRAALEHDNTIFGGDLKNQILARLARIRTEQAALLGEEWP